LPDVAPNESGLVPAHLVPLLEPFGAEPGARGSLVINKREISVVVGGEKVKHVRPGAGAASVAAAKPVPSTELGVPGLVPIRGCVVVVVVWVVVWVVSGGG